MLVVILLLAGMVLETFLGWGIKIVEFVKEKLR